MAEPVNPWSLLDGVDTLYTVSSGMGFEAALAGKRVVTFGSPFYSGWGFTDDRRLKLQRATRHPAAPALRRLLPALHALSRRLFAPGDRLRAGRRAARLAARPLPRADATAVCYNIKRWKRASVDRMLDGPAGPPLHNASVAPAVELAQGRAAATSWPGHRATTPSWKPRAARPACRSCGSRTASYAPPGSARPSSRPSRWSSTRPESTTIRAPKATWRRCCRRRSFPPSLVERGRRLRETLVSAGTTKYNVDPAAAPRGRERRPAGHPRSRPGRGRRLDRAGLAAAEAQRRAA